MEVKQVERVLKRYNYILATMSELKEQLDSLTYKATSTLDAAPAMSNGFHSKVEDMGIKRLELKSRIDKKAVELLHIKRLIEQSGLTEEEKGVMWCVAKEYRLQRYARDHKIQQSNIYKIRDRALKKIANHVT